ncbi:hypothetical protein DY000_02061091 [Brassica cretica]|uniref:Uncharacterized protein n=1 Tax=Brassica cretica TaxID=69181 RepID=A0ABQ7B166_BRACR|nr:hypothetical protein DY000_02061091 [Brassica cretica]
MLMNKSTSAAGKYSNPPPLNLVDYSDDEEKTMPQQSQTSQPLSEDLHTAAEQLDSESDAKSEPVRLTRKKKNVKEGRSKETSGTIPQGADTTKASKENRGKAIKVSSGESEEEDDSENTDSEEAEEVDAENVEPPVSVKEKEKKRKAPSSATQSNPVQNGSQSKGQLEKTVTGLGDYIPEIVKEFYAALPDAKSEPVRSTRKKKNVKEGRSKKTSEKIPRGADITKASKENRGKAIKVSSGESEEEDDSENTDSEEAEEVDAENVEPPVSVKEKEKKRKAPSSATQSNPVQNGSQSKGQLEKTVTGLGDYIPEIVKEFYAALPAMIDQYFDVSPLQGDELEVEETMDEVNSDELADFLTEGTREMKNLSLCKAALLVLAAYNLGVLVYNQVLNLGHMVQRRPREKLVAVIPYKKDPRQGEEYLNNKKEAREAEKKAQKQTKKKGKSASTSTAAPTSGPPPSTPRSERTDPSGYVPPRQSPRAAGKFQIIHLGSVASPGQPIDTTSEAIQQLATAMQTLTSVVGQIASMLFPRGEEEADDPQQ